jgi:hypothetical protein
MFRVSNLDLAVFLSSCLKLGMIITFPITCLVLCGVSQDAGRADGVRLAAGLLQQQHNRYSQLHLSRKLTDLKP